ncbi:MAG: hypothetical protein RL385_1639, partial [Pseudomonadota bacterium]|jgi:hypothetical protein
MRALILRSLLFAFWLLLPELRVVAHAEERSIWFHWQRPPASMCPGRATLEADVEDLLGRPVFTREADAELRVRGGVREDADGVYAYLDAQLADGSPLGRRELTAAAGECASLRQALALVLTLFAEESGAAIRRPRNLWPVQGSLRWGLTTGVLVGTLPRADGAAGVLLVSELAKGLRGRIDATYFFPIAVQTRAGQGARIDAAALGLRLCPHLWGERTLVLRACAGADLGAFRARPKALSEGVQRMRLLGQGSVTLEAEARILSRLGLLVGLGPTFPFARPHFYLRTADEQPLTVFRPGPVGAFLHMSLIISTR